MVSVSTTWDTARDQRRQDCRPLGTQRSQAQGTLEKPSPGVSELVQNISLPIWDTQSFQRETQRKSPLNTP